MSALEVWFRWVDDCSVFSALALYDGAEQPVSSRTAVRCQNTVNGYIFLDNHSTTRSQERIKKSRGKTNYLSSLADVNRAWRSVGKRGCYPHWGETARDLPGARSIQETVVSFMVWSHSPRFVARALVRGIVICEYLS